MKSFTPRLARESNSHRLVEKTDIVAGTKIQMVRRKKVANGGHYPTEEIIIDSYPGFYEYNGVEHVAYRLLDSKDQTRRFVRTSALLGHDDGGADHICYWMPL